MNPEFLPASGASRTVSIGDVVTEAGVTIFDAELRYFAFYDSPDGAADYAEFSAGPEPGLSPEERPIVLIEHALTGDGNAADWWADMVGPNKPIDTTRYLVLCANVLGGCQGSTGPSSPHPDGQAWGSRFPGLSIRDMVTAERLLLERVGVTKIHALVGASMGGARVLE
ncbi:alpha/beta fold hydrolase, partial [Corynebacterium evansiae]